MKRTKITIVYELFKRENINVTILKKALTNLGYDVVIRSKTQQVGLRRSDILIIPNCYTTGNYYYYIYRFNCKSGNIINLQIEQVYTKRDEFGLIGLGDGKSKELITTCWGQNRYELQVKNGMDPKLLYITGTQSTDPVKERFRSLWKTKADLAEEYGLDSSSKWVLFISSFSYATKDSPFYANIEAQEGKEFVERRHRFEKSGQSKILSWMGDAIKKSHDAVFIYRTHPTEVGSESLSNFAKEHVGRFFVISDYNLKQWILSCDTVTMWNSTSIVECYASKKNVMILRPEPLPEEDEFMLFDGCQLVTDAQGFIDGLRTSVSEFPVSKEKLGYYYDLDVPYAYEKICDIITSGKCNSGEKERNFQLHRIAFLWKNHILLKIVVKRIYQFLNSYVKFSLLGSRLGKGYFLGDWEYYAREQKELKELEKKIGDII